MTENKFSRRRFVKMAGAGVSLAVVSRFAGAAPESKGKPVDRGLKPVIGNQLPIARVELMPNTPEPFAMRDWRQVACDYVDFLLVPGRKFPSYVGGEGGPEALNLIAAVVSGTLAGRDMRTFRKHDWVK
ncbi:MAG: hypothetical protein WCN95_02875, partial [bacterium]